MRSDVIPSLPLSSLCPPSLLLLLLLTFCCHVVHVFLLILFVVVVVAVLLLLVIFDAIVVFRCLHIFFLVFCFTGLSNVYLKRQLTSMRINLPHHQEIPNQSIQSIQSNKIPLLDPSTAIYRVTIFVLLALLCVAVFMGMVYHSWYKGMQKRRYDIQGKLEAVMC